MSATWTIIPGDCRTTLATLDAQSVQTCVTSPPYFGLRDYGHDGQIGLEPTPDEFVAALVDVFRAVRRVLRDDGTVWLNLGSSFASATIESDAHVIREDITPEEIAYVYAELARAKSEAMSAVRNPDAQAEP